MLILFLALSAIFTVLLLLVSFENVAGRCTDLVLFFTEIDSNTTVTFLIFAVAFIGVMTGLSYAGLLWQLFKQPEEEDEDE